MKSSPTIKGKCKYLLEGEEKQEGEEMILYFIETAIKKEV